MLAFLRARNCAISLLLLSLLAAVVVTLLPQGTAPARANAGTILRTLDVDAQSFCNPSTSSPSVGIAFDGTELLVTCTKNNVILLVRPADGFPLGTVTVDGIPASEGIGAISWDANNNLLWAGTGMIVPQNVYSIVIDKASGTAVASLRFSHLQGGWSIVDGIAYDGYDDTIWFSPDISEVVYHYSLQGGALMDSIDVSSSLGGYGNSGLVVANDTTLYLANNGGSQIYTALKSGSPTKKKGSAATFFASLSGKRLEDLECDNVTFAPRSAIWSKDAYGLELNAFEVPAGQCAQGGVPEPPTQPGSGQRMTGGGSIFTSSGVRVTHGFELRCANGQRPNSLEINWGPGNNFHMERLDNAACSDDPTIEPTPPSAGFDTFAGKGTGRLNGVRASAEWTFTDAGEPGSSDSVSIVVKDRDGNVMLAASGNLEKGNHQAHK